MAFFQLKWLRRLVRSHTNPIPFDRANIWRRRFSLAYMLLAWQGFGIVCYLIYTGRGDWAKYYGLKPEDEANLTPGQYYSKTLNIKKGKIVRISGLTKINEEEILNLDDNPTLNE